MNRCMSMKEIDWWQKNHPVPFSILENAFGYEWIESAMKECVKIDHHRLAWCIYHPIEGNFEEVMLIVTLLEAFGSDEKIAYVISQLKNFDGYYDATCHLLVAYQFKRFGWNVVLEVPNGNRVVDFMATKGGEVAYVECSRKLTHAPMPFVDKAFMSLMGIFSPRFGDVDVMMEVLDDKVTREEIVALANTHPQGQIEEKTILESENVRFIVTKSQEPNSGWFRQRDLREGRTLAERMLRKIDDENKQTSSHIPIRVVALQLAGRPSPDEWRNAEQEIFRRLKNKRSKPDVVMFFKKRWDGTNIFFDIWSSLHVTTKGELLTPTAEFCNENEIII